MMRAISIVSTVLFLSSLCLAANGGSTYSIFGIGDLRYFQNTRSAAMGYTGIGLPGANYINGMSPATWARINQTRLDIGFMYEGFRSTDGSTSRYLANGEFNGALLAVPISTTHGIVFVAGFTPYSNINYNLVTKGSQQGIDYNITHRGTGGITKGQAGLSYAPSQDLAFGASINYLFGTVDYERVFAPNVTTFSGGTTRENVTTHGITATAGAVFTGLGDISESLRPFALGFIITSRGNLKTERQITYEFTSELDSAASVNGRQSIPIAYGFGLTYQLGDRYLFAADYYAQPWDNTQFNGVDPSEIRNNLRVGVGGERLANRDPSARWLDRISYRLGFFYDATYYRINREPINHWGVTGGFAIPISGETRMNVALEYGSRGTTNNHLIKDNIFRMAFSLNIGELWFIRYDEE
jgi:hypothetical protein